MDGRQNLCGIYMKKRREEQRITLSELQRLLKRKGYIYSVAALRDMEEGKVKMRDIEIIAICDALHIAPVDLFPIEQILMNRRDFGNR